MTTCEAEDFARGVRATLADDVLPIPPADAFAAELDGALEEVRSLLTAKNLAYGDSALNPVRLFSRADASEQIRVRIDDKISRMVRGQAAGEDAAEDLLGYLVLLKIARRRAGAAAGAGSGADDASGLATTPL